MVKIGLLDSDSEDDASQASPMVLEGKKSSTGGGKQIISTTGTPSTRFSLKAHSDDSIDNEDDVDDVAAENAIVSTGAEVSASYELKPSTLQMSRQPTVYVPDGVDPAFIKRAQTLFRDNGIGSSSSSSSSSSSVQQRFPPSVSPSDFSESARDF